MSRELDYLWVDSGNVSPAGDPFEGLSRPSRAPLATAGPCRCSGEDNQAKGWYVFAGIGENWIMGCHTPQPLPVSSALARGFAGCDHWYCSAPTMTRPNRPFACAGTSQGHLDDETRKFTVGSIFGALTAAGVAWKIYGYDTEPLTKLDTRLRAGRRLRALRRLPGRRPGGIAARVRSWSRRGVRPATASIRIPWTPTAPCATGRPGCRR